MPYHRTERSERVRGAARERILRAARTLFVRRGFDATTMQDIVTAAGTSIGNLYFYFPNKEELLGTLAELALRDAWTRGEAAMQAIPPGPARMAVMVYANAHGVMVLDRDIVRIMLAADRLIPTRDRIVDLNTARIRTLLRENFSDYPERDLDVAAVSWSGVGRYLLEHGMREGRLKESVVELARFQTRWNLRGLGVPERKIDEAIAVAERVLAKRVKP